MVIRLQRHPLAEDPPSHKKASKSYSGDKKI